LFSGVPSKAIGKRASEDSANKNEQSGEEKGEEGASKTVKLTEI